MLIALLAAAFRIILIVIAVVVCVAALLLFVPFIYRFDADIDEKSGQLKAKWLGGLISVYAGMQDAQPQVYLRVFGIKKIFYGEGASKKKKRRKTVKKKENHSGTKESVQTEDRSMTDGAPGGDVATVSGEGFSWNPDEIPEEAPERLFSRIGGLLKTLHNIRETSIITYTWPKISGFLHRIRPRRISGRVAYGCDDPATCGMITGGLAMMAFLYGTDLVVEPDFESERFYVCGNVHGDGRMFVCDAMVTALKLLTDRRFRWKLKRVRGKA